MSGNMAINTFKPNQSKSQCQIPTLTLCSPGTMAGINNFFNQGLGRRAESLWKWWDEWFIVELDCKQLWGKYVSEDLEVVGPPETAAFLVFTASYIHNPKTVLHSKSNH